MRTPEEGKRQGSKKPQKNSLSPKARVPSRRVHYVCIQALVWLSTRGREKSLLPHRECRHAVRCVNSRFRQMAGISSCRSHRRRAPRRFLFRSKDLQRGPAQALLKKEICNLSAAFPQLKNSH